MTGNILGALSPILSPSTSLTLPQQPVVTMSQPMPQHVQYLTPYQPKSRISLSQSSTSSTTKTAMTTTVSLTQTQIIPSQENRKRKVEALGSESPTGTHVYLYTIQYMLVLIFFFCFIALHAHFHCSLVVVKIFSSNKEKKMQLFFSLFEENIFVTQFWCIQVSTKPRVEEEARKQLLPKQSRI